MTTVDIQLVSIEGNIGSGKSTLMRQLRESVAAGTWDAEVEFVDEPVDAWDTIRDESDGKTILQKFYAEPSTYAFSFQVMAFISRLRLLRNKIAAVRERHAVAVAAAAAAATNLEEVKKKTVFIVSERSLFTDKLVFAQMLKDAGNIRSVEHQIYLWWFDSFAEECPLHHVVYVHTSPTVCKQRVQLRERSGEENVTLAYLEQCHRYHQQMIEPETTTDGSVGVQAGVGICDHVLKLSGDEDRVHDAAARDARLAHIAAFLQWSQKLPL